MKMFLGYSYHLPLDCKLSHFGGLALYVKLSLDFKDSRRYFNETPKSLICNFKLISKFSSIF